MLAPDLIPPEAGVPLAALLVGVWLTMEAHARRAELRRRLSEYLASYTTLDCRDGRHAACTTCDCGCHQ